MIFLLCHIQKEKVNVNKKKHVMLLVWLVVYKHVMLLVGQNAN